jgi:hypothetical protein
MDVFIVYKAKNGKAIFITSRKKEIEFLNVYSSEYDADNKYNISEDFDRLEEKDLCVLVEMPEDIRLEHDEVFCG